MRAAVMRAPGQPLTIEQITLDALRPHEVRVQVMATGICHTDLDTWSGRSPVELPAVLGHEPAGVVAEIGSDVTQTQVGDHVVCTPAPGCGVCDLCRTGRPYLCPARNTHRAPGDTPRLSLPGDEPVAQFSGLSGFAEQLLVHEAAVVPVDAALPWTAAAVLGCGGLTGIGAVLRTAQVRAGDRAVVVGVGGVGLAAVQACLLAGAERIVAVDTNPGKLDAARRFGATDTIVAMAEPHELGRAVRKATDGGADYAFDCVGTQATLELAYESTRTGGTTVLVGGFAPGEPMSLPGLDLVLRGKALIGSSIGSSRAKVDIPVYARMCLQGRLPMDQLVSDRFTLDDINNAFEQVRAGRVTRAVIGFGE